MLRTPKKLLIYVKDHLVVCFRTALLPNCAIFRSDQVLFVKISDNLKDPSVFGDWKLYEYWLF